MQCRVIGVMLEKETTTPDQYPLSLNGLMTACNQKSNREPVVSLSEVEVQNIVDELIDMQLVMVDRQSSSRVPKYIHRFCNTEFGDLKFSAQQRAIMCVLMLRGPQTPGELRSRTNRLAEFANVTEVEQTLNELQQYNGKILVKQLAREPGKRESRFVHLFSPQTLDDADKRSPQQTTASFNDKHELTEGDSESLAQRVSDLEQQVATLTEQVNWLQSKLS